MRMFSKVAVRYNSGPLEVDTCVSRCSQFAVLIALTVSTLTTASVV
jgi:hypothetical protein